MIGYMGRVSNLRIFLQYFASRQLTIPVPDFYENFAEWREHSNAERNMWPRSQLQIQDAYRLLDSETVIYTNMKGGRKYTNCPSR
jgi:hypothetical protein